MKTNLGDFSYLWPPRPETAIPRDAFRRYTHYVAQVKKQGTNNVLAVGPDRRVIAMTRHRTEHKAWRPIEATHRTFQNLPGTGWYVFSAELLHSKVAGIRNINYIHDLLVANGEYLVGVTFAERQKRLRDLFSPSIEAISRSHDVIDAHTWLAKNHYTGFRELFNSLTNPDDEGLVFKDPEAKLAFCASARANSSWQVKSRRPTKTHQY